MSKDGPIPPDILAACAYCGTVILADYISDPSVFNEAVERARTYQEKNIIFRGKPCPNCFTRRPECRASEYRVLTVRNNCNGR